MSTVSTQHEEGGRDRPRFSVIIPALDEEAVLDACLDSLREQTFEGSVEIIVVDNGSSDDTAEVASRHGARVLHEAQRGVCFARQRGLAASTADIVVTTDADTTFTPSWLQRIDDHFTGRPDAVAVAGPCCYVDGPWWSEVWQRLLFGSVALIARHTGVVVYVTATNLAFRREALDRYDTRLTQGGDELDVLRRLRGQGRIVFVADNPTLTSARRLRHGLLYTLIVSLGYYYILGYLINRVTGRRLLGAAPAFRPTPPGLTQGAPDQERTSAADELGRSS